MIDYVSCMQQSLKYYLQEDYVDFLTRHSRKMFSRDLIG